MPAAALVAALSIWGFVAFGGMKSFAKLGEAKIALLFVTLVACACAALGWGGFSAMRQNLAFQPWFNPFGRGFVPELGYLASMIVGVFTTQIYIQSFAAAKNLHAARRGAFASALLMPPMGLLGTAVGLSVRARGIEIQPDRVLSWFIMDSFPPLIGGLLWGGVVITVVGCAAGLMLGIATNIAKNMIPRERLACYAARPENKGPAAALAKAAVSISETALVALMTAVAAVIGTATTGSMILEWSFLSMGLRGAGSFIPFVLAVLRPRLLPPVWALASCCGGLTAMLAWAFTRMPGDPLFAAFGREAVDDADYSAALRAFGDEDLKRVRGRGEYAADFLHVLYPVEDVDGVAFAHDDDKGVSRVHFLRVFYRALLHLRVVPVVADEAVAGRFAEGYSEFYAGSGRHHRLIEVLDRFDEVALSYDYVRVLRYVYLHRAYVEIFSHNSTSVWFL